MKTLQISKSTVSSRDSANWSQSCGKSFGRWDRPTPICIHFLDLRTNQSEQQSNCDVDIRKWRPKRPGPCRIAPAVDLFVCGIRLIRFVCYHFVNTKTSFLFLSLFSFSGLTHVNCCSARAKRTVFLAKTRAHFSTLCSVNALYIFQGEFYLVISFR